jgi:hypothetical protein
MNQTQAVKAHLMSGKTLTSMEAFSLYGCTRLSDKVFRLRKSGLNIQTIMVEGETRYGTPCSYAKYKLVED